MLDRNKFFIMAFINILLFMPLKASNTSSESAVDDISIPDEENEFKDITSDEMEFFRKKKPLKERISTFVCSEKGQLLIAGVSIVVVGGIAYFAWSNLTMNPDQEEQYLKDLDAISGRTPYECESNLSACMRNMSGYFFETCQRGLETWCRNVSAVTGDCYKSFYGKELISKFFYINDGNGYKLTDRCFYLRGNLDCVRAIDGGTSHFKFNGDPYYFSYANDLCNGSSDH